MFSFYKNRLGIPVTPYYKNLDKEDVFLKGEAGFIKVIVYPLWELFGLFLEGEIDENIVEKCKNNQENYEFRLQALQAKKESAP